MLNVHWFVANWFILMQTLGVFGGLVFTGISLRQTMRAERVKFHFDLSENHANIWREIFDNPNLTRLLAPGVDLDLDPITRHEEVFVRLLIQHLGCSLEAWSEGLIEKPVGVETDINEFFSLPIPKLAWKSFRKFQSPRLVNLVESSMDESI
jgi:hypothetical protein